jgi:hypothetical protein
MEKSTKYYLSCEYNAPVPKEGREKESIQGERARKSTGEGCPYSLICARLPKSTLWELRYRHDYNGTHYCTHMCREGSGSGADSRVHRKLQDKAREEVRCLASSGVKPRAINNVLFDKKLLGASGSQEIRNEIRRAHFEERDGDALMDTLVQKMKTNGYIIRCLTVPRDLDENGQEIDDGSDRLQLVFFVNPRGLEYIKFYYKVVILDATYNTNSQDMPLLEFVGVEATGKSFCIAFTLLPGEREEDYQAAIQQFRDIIKEAEVPFPGVFITDKSEAEINAVKQIFPNAAHILCLWHANQSVQGECYDTSLTTALGTHGNEHESEYGDANRSSRRILKT